jgi:tetratricopeptide (TPR) repeat protein
MATLFVSLAALSFVRGLLSENNRWHLLAFACYVMAVASKEHAITAILLTIPLFVFVQRPPVRRIIQVAAVSVVVLAAMGAVLFNLYGSIVGTVFDETSRAFATQLEQQRPGISQQLYPLSIINQAALFFQYGLLWVLPFVGWMSIDLRPPFPLTVVSWQLAGAVAWIGVLAGGIWLVITRKDAWSLFGLGLLMPSLMFITEFSTVWLQDPFVLYRSYLWSISIPLLLALPLIDHSGRKLYAIVLIVVGVWAASAFDRIHSLQTPAMAWADAAEKIDRAAPANAVGRWRPLLNQGTEAQDRGDFEAALRLFSQAEMLGEPMGSARFNIGVGLQQLKQHDKALDNFAAAEAKGFTEAALYYHRGESYYAMGKFADAYASFTQSLTHPQAAEAEEFTRLRQAEAAVANQKYDEAITSYNILLQKKPDKQRYQVGLSMAHVGKKDYPSALEILNPAIAQRATGPALYARALTNFYMGNRAASAQDLGIAMRAEPNNPIYRKLQQMLDETTGKSADKNAAKTPTKP